MHLRANNEGDVWPSTGRTNRTWYPCQTPGTLWMTSLNQNLGTMDTQQLPNYLHLGCWWFWCKMFREITCPTPQSIPIRQVQSHHRLVGKIVYWNITAVGLWKRHGPSIHASICTCRIPLISTQETNITTRFTIPLVLSNILKE